MTTHPINHADSLYQKSKACSQCGATKPLTEFLRRTGRRSGKQSRRGTCRACRQEMTRRSMPTANREQGQAISVPRSNPSVRNKPTGRKSGATTGQSMLPKARHEPSDASVLRPTRQGFIRMRGKSDNGRRWYQEIDPELASVLVREGAAAVVNRNTIRRLFSNKEFRHMILTRDANTCYFCGQYGDTIDHKLPRAKGGHTTPINCVCACYECNQLKASHDLDEFMTRFSDE